MMPEQNDYINKPNCCLFNGLTVYVLISIIMNIKAKREHTTSFLASNVTFAPRLTASIAISLPIPLEPPVI